MWDYEVLTGALWALIALHYSLSQKKLLLLVAGGATFTSCLPLLSLYDLVREVSELIISMERLENIHLT